MKKPGFHLLIAIAAVLTLVAGAVMAASLEAAAQNPVIQSIFRERLILSKSITDNYGNRRYRGNLSILEMQVNSATLSYLQEVDEKLTNLESSMKALEENASARSVEPEKSILQTRRTLLNRLKNSALELHGSLAAVVRGFAGDDNFNPGSVEGSPSGQIAWLANAVSRISEEVSNYFLTPHHVISVGDLREENMLLRLDRVARMAEYLADHLEAPENRSDGHRNGRAAGPSDLQRSRGAEALSARKDDGPSVAFEQELLVASGTLTLRRRTSKKS